MKTDFFHIFVLMALGYSMYRVAKDDIGSARLEIEASLAAVQFLLITHKLK